MSSELIYTNNKMKNNIQQDEYHRDYYREFEHDFDDNQEEETDDENEQGTLIQKICDIDTITRKYNIPVMFWNKPNEQKPNITYDEYNDYLNDKPIKIGNKTILYDNDTDYEFITLIYNNGEINAGQSNLCCIDIDYINGIENINEEDRLLYTLNRLPDIWVDNAFITKSRNKKLPHLHIVIDDMPNFTQENDILYLGNGIKGDIKRRYIWERYDNDVYITKDSKLTGLPDKMPSISYNDIRQYLNEEKMNIQSEVKVDLRNMLKINNKEAERLYKLFVNSKYYIKHVFEYVSVDDKGRVSIKENTPYTCKICGSFHMKNTNRGFIWKSKEGNVYYKCRADKKEYALLYRPCLIVEDEEDKKPLSNNINNMDRYLIKEDKRELVTNISKEKKEKKEPNEENGFYDIVKDFERTHAKVVNKCIYIKQIYDKDGNNKEVLILNTKQIKEMYSHITYYIITEDDKGNITKEKKCFIDNWTKGYEDIRLYNDMDVYPYTKEEDNKCPKDEFNLWVKFDMEYIKGYEEQKEALDKILNHIKILCNNDSEITEWMIEWIAHSIQKPYDKPGKVPVFLSKQGAGKGTLMLLLSKMLGRNKVFETADPENDVFCRFNGMLKDAYIINMNEISIKDINNEQGKIKKLATDPTIKIEIKGKESMDIASYHRIIITTNEAIPIKTTQDDRRNVIIRCSDELLGNKDYFDEMYKLLDNVNVIKTCYEYFKSYKIDDNFRNKKPKLTEYQQDLQKTFTNPIELFIKSLTIECKKKDTEEKVISTDDLYKEYKEWCNKKTITCNIDKLKFSVRLSHLNIPGIITLNGKIKKKSLEINKLCKYFELLDDNGILIDDEEEEKKDNEDITSENNVDELD